MITLRSIKNLSKLSIEAIDGKIGTSKDCLFDDRFWTLRYLVADTGGWLTGKKILISPIDLKKPIPGLPWLDDTFPVELTSSEIEACPNITEHEPISRQYENEYARHFHHIPYWNAIDLIAPHRIQNEPNVRGIDVQDDTKLEHRKQQIERSSLRSARELVGYHIDAQGETFGSIIDFLIDDTSWKIHYLIVDTKKYFFGKRLLIPIDWIESFNWQEKSATMELSKSQIENLPEFSQTPPINKRDVDEAYRNYYDLVAN